ncbi:VOC family protein [Tistrella mobilis]|uniref:VOC family protein n=1 Tax=Tistrella mobilis TaxID=171437 RepID=UPI003557083C
MILGLDHLMIRVPQIDAAARLYAHILDQAPVVADDHLVRFRIGDLEVRLVRAETGVGQGAVAEGLAHAALAVSDLDRAARLMSRRGLAVDHGTDVVDGRPVAVLRSGTDPALWLLVEQDPARPAAAGTVTGLDHLVVASDDPERSLAMLGSRLGLDLRLDRANPAWGARMLFFRCGDAVVEVIHETSAAAPHPPAPDRLWGLCWRVADIEAAHRRLAAAGIAVTGIRTGRRPGTRVFTLSEPPAAVPTLMLQADR